jgi:hypothetical protein
MTLSAWHAVPPAESMILSVRAESIILSALPAESMILSALFAESMILLSACENASFKGAMQFLVLSKL